MRKIVKKELGKLLLEEKLISEEELQKALDLQKENKKLLGQCIVQLGYATEEDILNCIMVQYGFPYLPLENYEIDREVLKIISEATSREKMIMPVDKIGNILTIAMANPLDVNTVQEMERQTGYRIEVFITTANEIIRAIEHNYRRPQH